MLLNEYPVWALPVFLLIGIILLFVNWARKDELSSLKKNFSVQVDNTVKEQITEEIVKINDLDKSVLNVKDLIFLKRNDIVFPLIVGTHTGPGGGWMGYRSSTGDCIFTIAVDDAKREFFDLHSSVFTKSSEVGFDQVYFVKNLKAVAQKVLS